MGLGLGLGLGLASRVAIHAPAVEALGSRHRRLHKHLARRPPPVARAVAASQRGKADTAVLRTRSGAPAVAEVPGVAGEHGGRGGAKAGGAAGLEAGRRVGIAPACRSRAAACGQGVGATGPVREWCGGGAEAVRGRCRGVADLTGRRSRGARPGETRARGRTRRRPLSTSRRSRPCRCPDACPCTRGGRGTLAAAARARADQAPARRSGQSRPPDYRHA